MTAIVEYTYTAMCDDCGWWSAPFLDTGEAITVAEEHICP